MLKWVTNSRSSYPTKSGYKGIRINPNGGYVATVGFRLSTGHNTPKEPKVITIGTYDTLKEAVSARVNYILRMI